MTTVHPLYIQDLPDTSTSATMQRCGEPPLTALDVVEVDHHLGAATADRLIAMGVPCRPIPAAPHMLFLVPAGTTMEPLGWPTQVTYRTGGCWPIRALHPVTYQPSSAYKALVTPPAALWAVVHALTPAPPPGSQTVQADQGTVRGQPPPAAAAAAWRPQSAAPAGATEALISRAAEPSSCSAAMLRISAGSGGGQGTGLPSPRCPGGPEPPRPWCLARGTGAC